MIHFKKIVRGVIGYPVRGYRKIQSRRDQQTQDQPPLLNLDVWSRLHPSLKQGYKYCFAIVAAVWILCFVVAIWVGVSYPASPGLVYTLRTSSCDAIRNANFWIHLLINILASALYAISSYIMQRLLAPTREDIDKAHATGEGLNVGTLAILNLILLGRARKSVFTFLWASSLPIHLLFNSLFVYSSTNAAWPSYVFVLSASQLHSFQSDNTSLTNSSPRQITGLNSSESVLDQAQYIFHQQPQLTDLAVRDCIDIFGSGSSEEWGDVFVIHEHEYFSTSQDRLNTLRSPEFDYLDYDAWVWLCEDTSSPCNSQTILENGTWSIYNDEVTQCYARNLPSLCELNISLNIMIIMLVCISCKLVCIILAVSLGRSQSLLTIGDAVTSFLQSPDRVRPRKRRRYTSRRCRVMEEVAGPFWISSVLGVIGLSIAWWFFNFTFKETKAAYVKSENDFGFKTMLQFGFGQMPTRWTDKLKNVLFYDNGKNTSLTYTNGAMLANLPQVALSAFYLVFNNYATRLFVALEFRRFSTRRQGLRVSEPSKETKQRRAHFLQIPLRYSLLMMAIFTLLHTFLSQTLFLHRVYAVYPQSLDDPNDIAKQLVSMLGYSPVSCFALAILLTVLFVSGIVIGLIPIDWRFPDTSGSSLAISAACHPPEGTENSHEGEVRWGVTNKNIDGTVKCSFSLLPVRPPDVGEVIVNSEAESRASNMEERREFEVEVAENLQG